MVIMIYWVIESDGNGDPSSVSECLHSYFFKRNPHDIVIETKVVLIAPALHLAHQVLLFLFEVP